MNKSNKRWKVFVIVLCMLFTMTPGTVFADDSADLPGAEQTVTDTQRQSEGEQGSNGETSGEKDQTGGEVNPRGNDQPGDEKNLNDEAPLNDLVEQVFPNDSMLLQTQFVYFPDTKLKIFYKKNSNSGPKIEIKSVSYKDTGETNLNNPHTVSIPDSYFGLKSKIQYDASNYAPNVIIDKDDVKWVLNDQGGGQSTNVTVTRWGDKNEKSFHYKKCETPSEPTTGSITITKVVEGDPLPVTEETFYFTITTDGFSTMTSIYTKDSSSKTINNLAPGNYSVSEVSIPSNYALKENNNRLVSVVSDGDSSITFTNVYDEPTTQPTTGSITITKVVEGDPVPAPGATFTFTISNDGFATTASISSADYYTKTISNLPPGDYWITEEDIPEHYKLKGDNYRRVSVVEGGNYPITFTNIYDDPNCNEPMVYITKTVASYDGANMPSTGDFKPSINREVGKDVIFKIVLSCNPTWNQAGKLAGINDTYKFDGQDSDSTDDITDDLLVMTENGLKYADDEYGGFPHDALWSNTYYYIDTVNEKGTYTNTAYLYESAAYRMLNGENNYPPEIASSSAVVTVVSETPGPGPGPGPKPKDSSGSTNYYEVTYKANWPAGADFSGTVPTDSKNYTYNTSVSVKGNTDGLKVGTYTFEGWNTKADGTGTMYLPGNTFKITEDTVLYAQWKLVGEPAAAEPNAVSAETAGLDDVPKTGDTAPLALMLLLGLISLAAITLSRKKTSETEI